MKNRKILIAAFLCVSMLIVGVGYATLSGNLEFNGSAGYSFQAAQSGFMENLVLEFVDIETTGSAAQTDTGSASGNSATFSIATLATQGEKATITYKLTNANTVDADLTMKVLHEDGKNNPTFGAQTKCYFQIESVTIKGTTFVEDHKVLVNNVGDEVGKALVTVAPDESVEIVIVVELTETPASDITAETFIMHVTATSSDAAVATP